MSLSVCLRHVLLGMLVGLVLAAPAHGQTASSASRSDDDEDLRRRLAEPDFTLVNLPSTLRLPRHGGNFRLTHRFLGNLAEGSFADHLGNLFGLDNGAVIGLEFRYAPIERLQAIVHRSSFDKTLMFAGQYSALQQTRAWWSVSVSGLVSIEGTNNFRAREIEGGDHDHAQPAGGGAHRSPALGAIVSRRFSDRLAVYATPVWVHHSAVVVEGHRDTGYLGLGGRLRLSQRLYVVGEVSPRIGGYAPGLQEFAFGFEGRAGGHMFQLTFTNAVGTTIGQISQGGFENTLYLGFNLSRKFY